MRIQAFLFDLDGTVIDSEPNYEKADRIFLANHGITVPEELWPTFVGMGGRAWLVRMQNEFGLKGDLDALARGKDASYLSVAQGNTRSFKQIVKLARLARDAGIKTAIASGSTPEAIELSLGFAGIKDCFDVYVSADEVLHGKPFPDIFLESARRLGVAAAHCVVVEDSVYGVQAAKAARMDVIAVPYRKEYLNHSVYQGLAWLYPAGADSFDAEVFVKARISEGRWPECVPAV